MIATLKFKSFEDFIDKTKEVYELSRKYALENKITHRKKSIKGVKKLPEGYILVLKNNSEFVKTFILKSHWNSLLTSFLSQLKEIARNLNDARRYNIYIYNIYIYI